MSCCLGSGRRYGELAQAQKQMEDASFTCGGLERQARAWEFHGQANKFEKCPKCLREPIFFSSSAIKRTKLSRLP